MKVTRIAIGAALVLGLCGCLPVQTKVWETGHAAKVGDVVRVESRKGDHYLFRVYQTDEKGFYGVASEDHKKYRVPYAALKFLEVRKTETEWLALPVITDAIADTAVTTVMGPILIGD